MAREYDTLVRDRIPAIVEGNGERPTFHRATEEEYDRRILDKLHEEVEEYCESREIGELVDVLEVVHAICEHGGVTVEQLREVRAKKADRRGRFAEGTVPERVE